MGWWKEHGLSIVLAIILASLTIGVGVIAAKNQFGAINQTCVAQCCTDSFNASTVPSYCTHTWYDFDTHECVFQWTHPFKGIQQERTHHDCEVNLT